MEVKIQIPDSCELIKDGDTYIVKERRQEPPRSWEEFCKRCPITKQEYVIGEYGTINKITELNGTSRSPYSDTNICTSKEEAEAFLALMQLRQLRKAWVGDWEQSKSPCAGIFYSVFENKLVVSYTDFWSNVVLSFPTREMANDFLNCFRDLCETAKILL